MREKLALGASSKPFKLLLFCSCKRALNDGGRVMGSSEGSEVSERARAMFIDCRLLLLLRDEDEEARGSVAAGA